MNRLRGFCLAFLPETADAFSMSKARCSSPDEMRQARLKMPQRSFEQAWAQHDAAVTACSNFGTESAKSSETGRPAKDESSEKTRR